jgi:DNA-binding SARP family transcriptional activator/energy-coupling factor transporter ATP-binding protein EcfA2
VDHFGEASDRIPAHWLPVASSRDGGGAEPARARRSAPAVDFRILGPLEVRREDAVVALEGMKLRAVLVVLLLHPNESVHRDRLAAALWGEDAPATAAKTVQVYISRLRKALGDPQILATTPTGYRLRVRADELDAERFGRLVEDGRRAMRAGQAEHAADVLREALALWSGPPLAELAFEAFAQEEIARLEEQRLAALEARVEADLAIGRHAALVGELRQLVAASPTRQRLVCQLMLALYRCARQADALEAFHAVRRALAAEIGTKPGPELHRLQEAILRQDPALEPQPAVVELPRELDAAAAPPLTGRDAELAWLRERWKRAWIGAGALVAVTGAPGVGKSRLIAELAGSTHRAGAQVLYAAGTGPDDAILAALSGVRGATRPTLLVVDDADHAGDDVLAELAGLARVVSSHAVLTVVSATDAETLAGLDPGDALALEPLDAEGVQAIAVPYALGPAVEDLPPAWLLQTSDGVARRVHEIAGRWARREAARRVGAAAQRTATSRAELCAMESALTGDIIELQAARERLVPDCDDAAAVVCPYKGLASFEVADTPYFFGRERLVAELVARLVGAPLLAVVGPSGSGKSSVLGAGLLPALAGGVLPGSEGWAQAVIRPGEQPLRELAGAEADLAGDRPCVLAVDQFEETFTACRDEHERAAFVAGLVRIARQRDGRGIVVLAIRADHYGRCADYPELSSLLATNHVLVGPMRHDELRRAVEGPARRVGLRVDPELADALVADVEDQPGGLPLLSTALLELWQHRDRRRLRHEGYARTGGVRGAVGRLAEDVFGQLDDSQRTVARSVLLRLVEESESGRVEPRRVALAELDKDDRDAGRVIALLTARRLLMVSAETVEVAHEALLREWPRLRDWIEEERDGLRIHRRLTTAAREWRRLGQDPEALYRGSRLTEAAEWRGGPAPPLNALEREFLAASQARSHDEQATRRNCIALGFAVLTIALVAIVIAALLALSQGQDAQHRHDSAAPTTNRSE